MLNDFVPVLLTVNDYIMKTIFNFDWNYNGYDCSRFYLFHEHSEILSYSQFKLKYYCIDPGKDKIHENLYVQTLLNPTKYSLINFFSTIWYSANALLNPNC